MQSRSAIAASSRYVIAVCFELFRCDTPENLGIDRRFWVRGVGYPNNLGRVGCTIKGISAWETSFFLMTDARAEWFLRAVEDGQQPWRDLQAVGAEGQFIPYIDKLRETQELRNDDVTVMLIQPLDS